MALYGAYARARDVAVEAALHAGHLIRLHAGRIDPDEVRDKGTHDLVTAIDEEVQERIVSHLQQAFPDYEVLAEEGDAGKGGEEAGGYRWIIDPIDGTTNFTRGVPPYAVSIALQHEGEVVVGVVLDAARNELFTAVRGDGLYVNGARAGVSRTARLDQSVVATGFPYRAFEHIDAYLAVMRHFMQEVHGLRRPGAASIDLAYVAAGRFDGYFESGLMPWDVAAGLLLVEEGGGRVTDFHGARNPLFAGQLVASNGPLHEAVLEATAPLRASHARTVQEAAARRA